MTSTNTESPATDAVEYEKGSWQYDLDRSVKVAEKGQQYKKRAGELLWKGAQTAINNWTEEVAEQNSDEEGEGLATSLLEVMGNSRKGDVSKIKTVALAVRENGLLLDSYPNLSKAYAAARQVRVTAKVEKDEDNILASAVEALAKQAPADTGTTPEQAVAILFAKGEDEAARLIGDALGSDDARRGWLRAVAADINGRIAEVKAAEKAKADEERAAKKAKADEEKAKKAEERAKAQAEKETAKKATAKKTATKATAKATTAKAKPVAKAKAKATPVAKSE